MASCQRLLVSALVLSLAACKSTQPDASGTAGNQLVSSKSTPVESGSIRVLFDTDMGDGIGEVLTLATLHSLRSEGLIELASVTVSKSNEYAAAFTDIINTYYGQGDVPIGVIQRGVSEDPGRYIVPITDRQRHGRKVYARDLYLDSEGVEAGQQKRRPVQLFRQVLADSEDESAVLVVTGYLTNLRDLLESGSDTYSRLGGDELVRRKVKLLIVLPGDCDPASRPARNVELDVDAARLVFRNWPTPIVACGSELGDTFRFPIQSLGRHLDESSDNPISEALALHDEPGDPPAWNLLAALFAAEPDGVYFDLSPPGKIHIDKRGRARLIPGLSTKHRYLRVRSDQIESTLARLIALVTRAP